MGEGLLGIRMGPQLWDPEHCQEPKVTLRMPTLCPSWTPWPESSPGTSTSLCRPGSLYLWWATSSFLCLSRFPSCLQLQHACAFDLFSVMTFPFQLPPLLPPSLVVAPVKSQRRTLQILLITIVLVYLLISHVRCPITCGLRGQSPLIDWVLLIRQPAQDLPCVM